MSGSCLHPRFEGVGEVDAGAFLGAEAVAGLGELEADFHVRDGVGRHHQLVAVEAREQVLRHVVVPRGVAAAASVRPCCFHFAASVRWMTSMTSTRKVAVPVAGSRIWTKGSSGRDGALFARLVGERRELQAGVLFQHLAPGGGVGEAVGEAELGLQQLVDAADDVGDDGLRRVEDAALDLALLASYS